MMRIWSIQPEDLFEKLKIDNVLHCDPEKSQYITEFNFGQAYDWMASQMKNRIGHPPEGVVYPFWAWHTVNWKHEKPDLRCVEFRGYKENQVCLELEIPDCKVLLSDEISWHIVLNDGYFGNSSSEKEMDNEYCWLESLSPSEQRSVKQKSWENIFITFPPYEDAWTSIGKYIQATFWELRLDQVVAVRHFGRRK